MVSDMEKRQWLFMVVYYFTFFAFLFSFFFSSCNAIESPQYKVLLSESDVEIRLYRESSWMSALVRGANSFEKATKDGFSRLYQYIHGGNLNSSRITMTSPVLTSITQTSNGFDYFVRFYLSTKYELAPPQPNSELNLVSGKIKSHCVAVRKFSGFAKDDNISKEIEALVTSLDKILIGKSAKMEDKQSYSIAQYNASFHLSGRLNEVWMNVLGFSDEGCPLY